MDSQTYESPERIREDKRYIFERITMRMIHRQPYYEIKYIYNGERMTGYGSYSLAVLSNYLRHYFIQQTGYIWNCPKCGQENHSVFKKCPICGYERQDVQTEENEQLTDLQEEQEERLGVAPILHPKAK